MRKGFDDALHNTAPSEDGTFTAYSKEYGEHYHSTKDGALNESLKKHIIPAFNHVKDKSEVHILDICYGLGLNTLATVLYYKEHAPDTRLFIYSPELDVDLVRSLLHFHYPETFKPLRKIIKAISTKNCYEDKHLYIEVYLGDARKYVKKFDKHFDIIYQDAFSPASNPVLWTKEYFGDIANAIKDEGILTTYSTALKTRLALHQNGFFVYLAKAKGVRNFTLASLQPLEGAEKVDMEHKIACNPGIKPLSDSEVAQIFNSNTSF